MIEVREIGMTVLFREPLFYIDFIYSVSFLLMAGLIVKGITRATSMTLVSSFSMLAGFGFTHSITEMVDWVKLIRDELGQPESAALLYTSQFFLILSFVLLLQFAIDILTYKNSQSKRPRVIPSILVVIYLIVLFLFRISDIRQAGLIARHSFGFVGSTLSAVMFFRLNKTMKPLGNKKLNRGLIIAAVSMAVYAICGGLIVTPLFGLPIQLCRAFCAFALAFSAASILEIFKIRH